jgi:hypothetical protein
MFPDYQGKGLKDGAEGKFLARVRAAAPGALMIPVLNGGEVDELHALAGQHRSKLCAPIVAAGAKNLVDTLTYGYGNINYHNQSDSLVVRLDTAEHPPEFIPQLVQTVMEQGGMVIGDLMFPEGTLRSESVDEFVHLDAFPGLYDQMTNGKVRMSCAHGYQAFAPGCCRKIFSAAWRIVEEVKKSGSVQFGFDGAMALAAAGLGEVITIVHVPAETLRDRKRAKIANQFANALRMCLAARKLYTFA